MYLHVDDRVLLAGRFWPNFNTLQLTAESENEYLLATAVVDCLHFVVARTGPS